MESADAIQQVGLAAARRPCDDDQPLLLKADAVRCSCVSISALPVKLAPAFLSEFFQGVFA